MHEPGSFRHMLSISNLGVGEHFSNILKPWRMTVNAIFFTNRLSVSVLLLIRFVSTLQSVPLSKEKL